MIADYVCQTDVLGTRKTPIGRKTSHTQQFVYSGELNMSVDDLIEKVVIAMNRLSSDDIRELIENVVISMKHILIEKLERFIPCK